MRSVFIILGVLCAFASSAGAQESPWPPGVVVAERLAFVSTPTVDEGPQLVAVNLETGKVAWRSEVLDFPIAEFRGVLVAREPVEGGFRIVLADPATGKVSKRFAVKEARLADLRVGLGDTKEIVGHVRGDQLYVSWGWSHRTVRGVRSPTPEPVEGGSGVLKIDLRKRTAVAVEEVPEPEATQEVGESPHDPAYSIRCGTGWCRTEFGGERRTLDVLRIGDDGVKQPRIAVSPFGTSIVFDLDSGRHVLGVGFSVDEKSQAQRLRLIDLQSGKEVARMEGVAPNQFVVRRGRMIGVDDWLTIWDLGPGKLLGRFEVARFSYRGPKPP